MDEGLARCGCLHFINQSLGRRASAWTVVEKGDRPMRLFKANQNPTAEDIALAERLLTVAARSKAQRAPDLREISESNPAQPSDSVQ